MSGSIRLTGVNGLPLGGSGLRYPGVYAAFDFANSVYEVGGVSRRSLSAVSGLTSNRTSLATMFDSTGKLTYGPNNLVTYSQEFDNAAWLKTQGGVGSVPVVTPNTALAPDGTMTADTVVFTLNGGTASGDISQIQQVAPFSVQGISSFWAMTTDGSSKVFTFVGPGGSSATITITGTYQRFYLKDAAAGSSTMRLRLRGGEGTADSASIYLWGAQLEAVTHQTTPSAYYPTTTAAYYGARFGYDPVTLAALGFLHEPARTWVALWNRDLTNAAWTKTNVTAAKNQTGIDGVANSASLLTATAGNGTCLQAITLASSARQQSAWVKRVTGSGAVEMTTDNGTTWTAITVTASWSLVTIPVQTLANPTVGFRIVTSGDAIAVDFVGNEGGTGASSPVLVTTASVTRAADLMTQTIAQVYPIGLTVWWRRAFDTGTEQVLAQLDAGDDTQRAYASVDSSDLFAATTSGSGVSTVAGATAVGTSYKGAIRIATNDVQSAAGGTLGTADTSATNPTNPTRLVIGSASSSGNSAGGYIAKVLVSVGAPSDAQLQSRSA